MTIMKCIDGVEIEMTPEEEVAFLASQSAEVETPPPPPDPVEKLRVFLDENPDVKAVLGL